eukprot:scaffold879_cov170-Ochromonas_danica.AAC.4
MLIEIVIGKAIPSSGTSDKRDNPHPHHHHHHDSCHHSVSSSFSGGEDCLGGNSNGGSSSGGSKDYPMIWWSQTMVHFKAYDHIRLDGRYKGYKIFPDLMVLGGGNKNRSFFVNGWQAWSFCGAVMQGQSPPIYSMPNLFVQNFHHGGIGSALPINLGEGKIPYEYSLPNDSCIDGAPSTNKRDDGGIPRNLTMDEDEIIKDEKKSYKQQQRRSLLLPNRSIYDVRDYVAADMFTVITDLTVECAIVLGFLSQQQQFGSIATNRNYDQLSIHISGDEVLIPSQGLQGGQSSYSNRTLTKAQVIRHGMDIIIDELEKIGKPYYLLGCGAPLGSVIGKVHANRISADAGLTWLPGFPLPSSDKWNLPCARNMRFISFYNS